MMETTVSSPNSNPMERLRRSLGNKVDVEYVNGGQIEKIKGVLRKVEDFSGIDVETKDGMNHNRTRMLVVLGFVRAVRSVSTDQTTIYDNRHNIPKTYNVQNPDELHILRTASFGRAVADRLKEKEKDLV